MKKISVPILAGLLLTLPSAYATLLQPGNAVLGAGDVFTFNPSDYTVEGVIGPTSASMGALSIQYAEAVVADTHNAFCSGCLDFAILLQNSSARDTIESISTGNFTGYRTDVGILSGLNLPSTVDPDAVSRSSDGSTIHFSFLGSDIPPGSYSDVLVIETDATSFVPGSITVQDDVTVDVAGFAPAPEPMSLSLLGGGLTLFGVIGIRRRMKAKK
jgi:hypothetical protein